MEFVVDPAIATKIAKMKQRVCWQGQPLAQRQIDQTCLALENASDHPEFSFLVIGDSGSGPHRGYNPQRQIVEAMLPHRQDCQFVLHTGDVIYLVGSSEYYPKNFIRPYREFLVGGDQPHQIAYDQMVFNLPFLPVPGNHDYYDLPLLYGVLAQVAFPIRKLLRSRLDFDVAWHGSYQGDAYARAFLDYLKRFKTPRELEQHLDRHYTAMTETGRCLHYQPGVFTRLPNRYYSFRMGGIDFFALDSNTFNAPPPLPSTPAGDQYRHYLEQQREDLNRQMLELTETAGGLRPEIPREADQLDDIHGKLEQLTEVKKDIDKQLSSPTASDIDTEQLTWLEQRLVQSWQTPGVRGRVLYFHHPPYVTEATK